MANAPAPPWAAVLDCLLERLHEHYVTPTVAQNLERVLRERQRHGTYDRLIDPAELCAVVTTDLQAVSRDKHLGLRYSPEPRPLNTALQQGKRTPETATEWRHRGTLQNFGFRRVERLAGNVGYLDLVSFFPTDLGGNTAVAAMNVVAHTSALIIDLRENGGGSDSMVTLLTSYLVDPEPIHLADLHLRAGDTLRQCWTLPYVPGERYGDKPVYLLTSRRTISAGEEFAYNLQALKRATLVGEATAGAAHLGAIFQLDEHFSAWIPTGRVVNPITGTDWEGEGVRPDVAVTAELALPMAYRSALEHVLTVAGGSASRPYRALVEEAQAALAALGDTP